MEYKKVIYRNIKTFSYISFPTEKYEKCWKIPAWQNFFSAELPGDVDFKNKLIDSGVSVLTNLKLFSIVVESICHFAPCGFNYFSLTCQIALLMMLSEKHYRKKLFFFSPKEYIKCTLNMIDTFKQRLFTRFFDDTS